MEKFAVLALVCVLVGCGDELAGSEPEPLEPAEFVSADAGDELVESDAAVEVADSAAVQPVQPTDDAAVEPAPVADASVAPDAALPVKPSKPAQPVELCELHRDADGDGFGAAEVVVQPCNQRAGMVLDARDCFDGNAAAHPGAVEFFTTHRGDGSFDYDCDGVELQRDTNVQACPVLDAPAIRDCYPPNTPYKAGDPKRVIGCYDAVVDASQAQHDMPGWWETVPACGQFALYDFALSWSRETSYVCHSTGIVRYAQACR